MCHLLCCDGIPGRTQLKSVIQAFCGHIYVRICLMLLFSFGCSHKVDSIPNILGWLPKHLCTFPPPVLVSHLDPLCDFSFLLFSVQVKFFLFWGAPPPLWVLPFANACDPFTWPFAVDSIFKNCVKKTSYSHKKESYLIEASGWILSLWYAQHIEECLMQRISSAMSYYWWQFSVWFLRSCRMQSRATSLETLTSLSHFLCSGYHTPIFHASFYLMGFLMSELLFLHLGLVSCCLSFRY